MTVEQLIEELEKHSPGQEVACGVDGTAEYFVNSVRERDNVVLIEAIGGREV